MLKPSLHQSSLFRRLMLGFAVVILIVELISIFNVVYEAKVNQYARTASENKARAREIYLALNQLAGHPDKIRAAASAIEGLRAEMFAELHYASRVRLRIWEGAALVYNSAPALPAELPSRPGPGANGWVRWIATAPGSKMVVERYHEVDDEWMFTPAGLRYLLMPTVLSLPFLLLPAWLIIGIGLRPLRAVASAIEQRSVLDLTALPASKYTELSPLVDAINRLMVRLTERIEREHEFLSDAAHELKTPLTAIQINTHRLQSRYAGEAALDGICDGVARATHMVHQLLSFERMRTEAAQGDLPVVELSAFLRERVALAAAQAAQREIDIELDAPPDCKLALHRESLAALLDNLIGNAVKYSPERAVVLVRLMLEGEGARLTIADRGPGIAAALRAKVFERFYRVPGQDQQGSGLGLAIAERAAARNSAAIGLESVEGGGLCVVVQFRAGAI